MFIKFKIEFYCLLLLFSHQTFKQQLIIIRK